MAGLVVGWLCWQWATRLLGTSEGLVPVPAACVSCAVVWGLTCGFLGLGALSLELLALCVPLVTLSLADFAVRIIPNECVLAVLAVHLCRVAMRVAQGSLGLGQALAQVLAGGACALVPLLALTLVMDRVLQAESMGGGDLKLRVAGGVCVGWRLLPFLLFLACCLGLCTAALPRGGARRGEAFAFGPSIAVALWLTMLFAPVVDTWLLTWVF